MLSNIAGTNFPFGQSQPEIEFGKMGGPFKAIHAKNQLLPQNLGGPYSKNSELYYTS